MLRLKTNFTYKICLKVFCVFHTVHYGKLYKGTNKSTYELYTLFIDHTYVFRSPSATILRVYGIKITIKTVYGELVQDLNLLNVIKF